MTIQTAVTGTEPADPGRWSFAVPDWERRITARQSLVPPLPLFTAQAEKALRVFKRLRVPDLPGQPTFGEVCGPWVFDLVAALFGSLDPESGRRHVREVFALIPKGNGKTTLMGAIMVTAMILNRRPNADGVLLAPTEKVAERAFGVVRGIILADAELVKVFHIKDHRSQVIDRRPDTLHCKLEILAADLSVVTGGLQSYTLVDETHELARLSQAEKIMVELRGALKKRTDGFLVQITTQSKEPPRGLFAQELKEARDIRDGKIDLPRLCVLYELPAAMQRAGRWRDPATWGMVNPNLGLSVHPEDLANEIRSAEAKGPAALALIASQHFNVEVGVGLKAESWVGAEFWEQAFDPALSDLRGMKGLDALMARCEVVTLGGDGGGRDDLLGLYAIGREKDTRRWIGWGHAWAHPKVLERRPELVPLLQQFAADGDVTILDENDRTGDVDGVAAVAKRILDAGLFPEKQAVGIDRLQEGGIIDALASVGISDEQLVGIPQGYRLSGAIWGTERKLADGTFAHGGQPMMGWVLGNAKAVQKGNAVLIDKETAGKAKIDPLIALFCAHTLMALNPTAAGSGYTYTGL